LRDTRARARSRRTSSSGKSSKFADDASGDYVTTSDGKRIVDHENIQRSRLRVDARKWAAARPAPKKYGDHISHDVKGPGANFQPAILITVDGQPHDEFARQLAYDEGGGVRLDGNGDIVRSALSRNFAVELGQACAPWIGLSRGRPSTSIQNENAVIYRMRTRTRRSAGEGRNPAGLILEFARYPSAWARPRQPQART
jgi:hypothetical protein